MRQPASSPPASPLRSCDQAEACVVIPVYNHARTVAAVVRGALAHASTVMVCDDGSTDGSGAEAQAAGAILLTLPSNRGKGAALTTLFAEATRRGFKYAISIDADGQHLPSDLPALARAAIDRPGALVVGVRDLIAAGAPGSSEFGRKFSNFWVWFEAGAKVDDSQCGLRAYPLPDAAKLGGRLERYDFEVEILLRAAWAGIPIVSVPVGVLYPADRITHFRGFVDNLRISVLNTLSCLRLLVPWPLAPRLHPLPRAPGLSGFAIRRWFWLGGSGPLWRVCAAFAGALAATSSFTWSVFAALGSAALFGIGVLPTLVAWLATDALLAQGGSPTQSAGLVAAVALLVGLAETVVTRRVAAQRGWTGKSRGGVFGHWFFFAFTRLFGIAAAYLALYPVALYYVFAASAGREASLSYLDRALGPASGLTRFTRSFRHFLAFAHALVDRAVLGTRGKNAFTCEHEGLEHLKAAADAGRGAVLLTAHMGNWEIASGLLDGRVGAPLAIVAFQGEEARLQQFLDKSTGPMPRVISVGKDELSSLEILRALRGGTLVAMQGDRSIDTRVVQVPFLGSPAPFPVGPFALAAISGAPLISTFAIQVGRATYWFVADPPRQLRFEPGRDRDSQLAEWVASYVQRLEELVRKHPYQWFNFYDFWNGTADLKKQSAPPAWASRPASK